MELQMKPAQKTGVSQRMVESSEILQMNIAELHQYLENLSLENPLMELDPPPAEQTYEVQRVTASDEQNRTYERQDRKDSLDPWNLSTNNTETLSESLIFQLSGLKLKPSQHRTLEYMILNLEPSGYLEMELADIAEAVEVPLEEAEKMLQLLQTMEPDGIGARSLPECLCIQLQKNFPKDETAFAIARNHLEMLGKNQLPALAKKLHQPLDEILRACRVIRSLNPRPGASFGDRRYMQYIHPELIVVKFQGYFDILLSDAALPRIHPNSFYLDMLESHDSDEVTAYLSEKKKQLDWVTQCMEQRSKTLLALGRLIVEKQQGFFRNGPGYLSSFNQAEAAALLHIDESTISRTVRDKFLQCSFGIFPLSYFFVQGIEDKDTIKRRIRELIKAEDKKHPLSDQKISDRLAAEDWNVSKRLVTKYRNELGIREASGRKEF